MNRLPPLVLGLLCFAANSWAFPPLPYPSSPDIDRARTLSRLQPEATPAQIARQVFISPEYKEILVWMREDLENYLKNFDAIFAAKLARIQEHYEQRQGDFLEKTLTVRRLLKADPDNKEHQAELDRLTDMHKAHGFVGSYKNAADYIAKYVGPRGKLVKSQPSQSEEELMNRPGIKKIYVDTWAVPFFNTGTQSREQAKEGLRRALQVFHKIDLEEPISVLRFTELTALFARPEFNDVRRYKLLPFPDEQAQKRFGLERSDAKTFGDKYPQESPVFLSSAVGLDTVSFIFGQRISIFGLISHSLEKNIADGRVFTGPADFLEHDYAHAFFNLEPAIPGSPEEWAQYHREYMAMKAASQDDPKLVRMLELINYHFTHESGFRVIRVGPSEKVDLAAFENEISVIEELLHTRHHYDFIIANNSFPDGYKDYLEKAFGMIGHHFRDRFIEIQKRHNALPENCQKQLPTGTTDYLKGSQ